MNKNFFYNLKLHNTSRLLKFNINFGPQHPAAHGVLRLILQLNNEVILKSDTHIGLLHRGTEKLIETKNYLKSLPYFDRLDYVSVLCQEHAFCLAIEDLLETPNYKAYYIQLRVIFDELTRILNHLMAVSTHALDVGCMAPVFWCFEEREKIMEFYERVSGARLHAALYRPNDTFIKQISKKLLQDILLFCNNFLTKLNILENTLNNTSIWKNRLVNIGQITKNFALSYGLTGVLARSAGCERDIRLNFFETYANYYYLNFRSYIGSEGDCYDRYLIRMREMLESTHIISQTIQKITSLKINNRVVLNDEFFKYIDYIKTYKVQGLRKSGQLAWYTAMEDLINHFKFYAEGYTVPRGFTFRTIESPKGEFGVHLTSDSSNYAWRCKIRSPSFYNLQAVDSLLIGHSLADLITIIGSHDIVLGEVDR